MSSVSTVLVTFGHLTAFESVRRPQIGVQCHTPLPPGGERVGIRVGGVPPGWGLMTSFDLCTDKRSCFVLLCSWRSCLLLAQF